MVEEKGYNQEVLAIERQSLQALEAEAAEEAAEREEEQKELHYADNQAGKRRRLTPRLH